MKRPIEGRKAIGTIFEVECPHCGGLIKHIHKLKWKKVGTLILCRVCRGSSSIVSVQDDPHRVFNQVILQSESRYKPLARFL